MLITKAVVAAANVAMYCLCFSLERIPDKHQYQNTMKLCSYAYNCLFVCFTVWLLVFVYLSISSVCLSVCHSVCLCVCLSVFWSVCLSVCVCLSAHVKLISSCNACTVYDSAKSHFHSQHLKVKIFFRTFINMGAFETMLQDRLVHALFDAV